MISILHQNKKYVNGEYIISNAPIYSKGVRGARDLIKKKNISNDKYIFARKVNDKFIITDGKSAKVDKVFFIQSLIKTIPELNKETEEKIVDDRGIEKAPNLIYLKDEEKFKDNQGNVIEIETRGERKSNQIYFKVKDVAISFELNNLENNIQKEHTTYNNIIDYKFFICDKKYNILNNTSKITNDKSTVKKELFLTYQGMLRVLFVSRNNKTSSFISWATDTLFTVQMGSVEQKDKLVSQVKGVSYNAIQELFSINARELPCVYLTAFNTVKTLRNDMNIDNNIPDDSLVYKFGLTKSFESRKNGHKSEYKELDKLIDMKLVCYTYIDPLYISEAEGEIKSMLEDYKINYKNHDELIVIPNNMLKFVKKIYENLGMKYSGHTAEFNKKIAELELIITNLKKDNEKLQLNHMIDLQKEQHNIMMLNNKLELQKEKYENEILKKEVEMMKLQLQYKQQI